MKAVAINIDQDQLEAIRERMDEANQRAHFVIFKSVERATGKVLRLITDIESFRTIREQHQDDSDMMIEAFNATGDRIEVDSREVAPEEKKKLNALNDELNGEEKEAAGNE